jgi:transcriptional regulator with XRE-family HTH domain
MESIKRVRQAKGLSLRDVARLADLHHEQVARAERAGIDVRASTLIVLAKALDVPVCELFPKEVGHAAKRRRRPRRR